MTKELSDAEFLRSITHRFNSVHYPRIRTIAAEIERLTREVHRLKNELTAAGLDNERLNKKCSALALLHYGSPDEPNE